MTSIAPAKPIDPSAPLDLAKLDSGQKLAAVAFVLSKPDMPIPPPPSLGTVLGWGADDVKAALGRIRRGDKARFANLLGAVGGATGVLVGATVGKLFGDRKAWGLTVAGAVIGTYPPAIAGHLVDRVID